MIHCTEIPGESALEFWSEVEPFVIRALAYDIMNSTSTQKLRDQVSTGFARVLVCSDDENLISATIVQLHKNILDERILHVVATAGKDGDDWFPVLCEGLKDMAESESCAAITMSGRPGWARKLTRYGFKTDHVHMRLNTNGRSEQVGVGEPISVIR